MRVGFNNGLFYIYICMYVCTCIYIYILKLSVTLMWQRMIKLETLVEISDTSLVIEG